MWGRKKIEKLISAHIIQGFVNHFQRTRYYHFLTHKINKGSKSEKYTGLILINLLSHFLRNGMHWISWFESHLSGGTFKINIDKMLLDPGNLSYGIPRRSIFGSLLFLLYVNDMPQVVKCDLFLYAEDACLTFRNENVKNWKSVEFNFL